MKIIINDFGPIDTFTFDLKKDFHLIVGENNVGKSYAITIVYLLVKTILNSSKHLGFLEFYLQENTGEEILEKISSHINKNEITINDIVQNILHENLTILFLPTLSDSIKASFNSIENLSNQFSNKSFCIDIVIDNFSFSIVPEEKELSISNIIINHKYYVKIANQNRKPRKESAKTFLYFSKKDKSNNLFIKSYIAVIYDLYISFFNEVHEHVKSVHYLPASRSGLYQALSAFGQIVAELSKNRAFLTKKIELPGISEPLSDYFLKLSEIRAKKRSFQNKPINQIAQEIEENILHGIVEFDPKTKRLIFSPEGTSLHLDLSSTSSMVSELSPIVSYLRYVLTVAESKAQLNIFNVPIKNNKNAKHLIIIEEPEAHLHPEVQIKITEIFAKLVKIDVKIIITSHSNFIFNKVNNLILEKDIDITKSAATIFKNNSNGSVGYQLETDDLGIDDENFIDAAELLFEEKTTLIANMNKND
ncbi:MAG: hypothetical protein D3924_13550 [Candidatus Electrothrix sp. AR4]|nr:hypothetical protein [Candidatus Electrothrix sp. AR4]